MGTRMARGRLKRVAAGDRTRLKYEDERKKRVLFVRNMNI